MCPRRGDCSHTRTRRPARCRCHKRQGCRRSRPRRRTRRRHPHRLRMFRHMCRGRPARSRCSRSSRRGCQRSHTRTWPRGRCRRRRCQTHRRTRPRRRIRRPDRHPLGNRPRSRLPHRAGRLRTRSQTSRSLARCNCRRLPRRSHRNCKPLDRCTLRTCTLRRRRWRRR